MPRLTLQEFRDLARAGERLQQVSGALRSTNWAGSPLAQAFVREAYEVIAGIYLRAEPYALKHPTQGGPSSSFPPAAEGGTAEGSGEG